MVFSASVQGSICSAGCSAAAATVVVPSSTGNYHVPVIPYYPISRIFQKIDPKSHLRSPNHEVSPGTLRRSSELKEGVFKKLPNGTVGRRA